MPIHRNEVPTANEVDRELGELIEKMAHLGLSVPMDSPLRDAVTSLRVASRMLDAARRLIETELTSNYAKPRPRPEVRAFILGE